MEIGMEPSLWRWTLNANATGAELMTYLEQAFAAQADQREVPFVTVERASGRVIGSTRYLNIDAHHRRLEIGSTWVSPPWQRSAINSEAKLLQLTDAFERLGALRVEFKTDSLNEKSRSALLGIGATFEGIFRNHMVTDSGRRRHSAYYSVIADEWPAVKALLQARVDRLSAASWSAIGRYRTRRPWRRSIGR
jgi:RimJ/RimL family protein N-acetyltransferase